VTGRSWSGPGRGAGQVAPLQWGSEDWRAASRSPGDAAGVVLGGVLVENVHGGLREADVHTGRILEEILAMGLDGLPEP
jgi:hypothetical protein